MVAYSNQSTYNAYKQQTAKTASPGELTLMLYEGCIKFIKLQKMHIEDDNPGKAHEASMRAQRIFNELMATLDMKYEISTQLSSLYYFMLNEVKAANLEKDAARLPAIIELMTELRDTWSEAVKINRKLTVGSVAARGSSYEA